MSFATTMTASSQTLTERTLPHFGTDNDITSLTSALRMIAAQQRRIRELENETETDALTGLLNGRGFHRALAREMDRAQRQGTTSAVLVLFDLDGLKQVNDTLGHLAGDACIAGFAHALKRRVRTTDYVARLGGDEFALLLTDGEPHRLQGRAVTLSEHLNREIVIYNDMTLSLKASHGAINITPSLTAAALMKMADTAMYRCKEARRILSKHLAGEIA